MKSTLYNLIKHWWVLLIRGILGVIFALIAFFSPFSAIGALVIFFGIFILIDGIISAIISFRVKNENDSWWAWLLEGVIGIMIGLFAVFYPGLTSLVVVMLVAAWAIISGVLQIVFAIRLRKDIEKEWVWILSGVLSIILGIIFISRPETGVVVMSWMLGGFFLFFGVLMIALSFRLRKLHQRRDELVEDLGQKASDIL